MPILDRLWTDEEDERLRGMYGTMTAKRIGEILGRSERAIHNRVHTLGLQGRTRRWTLKDEAALLDYLRTHTYQQAARKFGVTRSNICIRAARARRRQYDEV